VLLWDAIHTLGQAIPHDLQGAPVSEQLRWAVDHWDMELVPKQKLLAADSRFTDGVEG